MKNHVIDIEVIANDLLKEQAKNNPQKPNYTNRHFLNCIIVLQDALMDKMWDLQEQDNMSNEERLKMANSCGKELRKFIHTFTGLDTHNTDQFLK